MNEVSALTQLLPSVTVYLYMCEPEPSLVKSAFGCSFQLMVWPEKSPTPLTGKDGLLASAKFSQNGSMVTVGAVGLA